MKPPHLKSDSTLLFTLRAILIGLFFCTSNANGSAVTDSLKKELDRAETDSLRLKILDKLAWNLSYENLDSGFLYAQKSLYLATKLNNFFHQGKAYNTIGTIYTDKGKFKEATEAFNSAIFYYEKANSKSGVGYVYANMSNIEQKRGNFDRMLKCLMKSHEYFTEVQELRGLAGVSHNLAAYYIEKGNLDSAYHFINISLKINREKKWEYYIANNISVIAQIETTKGNLALADQYFNEAKAIFIQLESSYDICHLLQTQSDINIKNKRYREAISQLLEAKSIAEEIGLNDDLRMIHQNLSLCYENSGDLSKALIHYKKYSEIKDSVRNEENMRQLNELNNKMENTEREKQIELLKKDNNIKSLESEKQKDKLAKQNLFLIIAIGFSLLFIILVFVLYRGNQTKQKNNKLLSHQKEIIEEKNKEIVDSINYARRLQEAILPGVQQIKNSFSDSSILYLPKDIVAGDFYYLEEYNNHLIFASCDCTGHGVPGAMVSVVCANALHRAVNEFQLYEPGKILDKVRELVIETFDKNQNEVRDGMDISLCSLNKITKELRWAGANNPLWILKEDQTIQEIKADKQPIGKFENAKPFTTQSINYDQGDLLILPTDGYSDQFGGENLSAGRRGGKKLKDSQFKLLIQQYGKAKAEDLKNQLEIAFQDWKGDLEQIDDICIFMVRI